MIFQIHPLTQTDRGDWINDLANPPFNPNRPWRLHAFAADDFWEHFVEKEIYLILNIAIINKFDVFQKCFLVKLLIQFSSPDIFVSTNVCDAYNSIIDV